MPGGAAVALLGLAGRSAMKIETEASIVVMRDPETVFDFATAPGNMPAVFTGYGPIPAIEKVENIDDDETKAGTIRLVINSDGSVIEEEVLEFSRPHVQQYRLNQGFRPPFSFLVRSGGGHWTFDRQGDQTHIVWKFYFELTNPLVYPIASVIVRRHFQRAMRVCLSNIKAQVEAAARQAA
jgi:hypothetical protein